VSGMKVKDIMQVYWRRNTRNARHKKHNYKIIRKIDFNLCFDNININNYIILYLIIIL